MSQFLAPVLADAEEELERSLRPRTLSDFVGQERVKERLPTRLRGLERDRELLLDTLLPDEVAERARAERALELLLRVC